MLVLAIVALEVPLASSVADRVDAEVRSQARAEADVVAALASGQLRDAEALERLVDTAAESSRGRVIIVDRRGFLLADSEATRLGRSYAGRPEIAEALAGRGDQRERDSLTLGESVLATATPIVERGQTAGAVRVTQNFEAVERAVRRAWLGLALIGLLVLGVGLLAGSFIATQIARPVTRLNQAARRVAEGDLSARAEVEGSSEQRSLARTFNEMTERLERLVASQREFVADASHQLRTPLTGLRLRLEAAGGDARDRATREDLEAAVAEVDRLSAIVRELLELSRAGERDVGAEPISLADAAARAVERWTASAEQRRQRLEFDRAGDGTTLASPPDIDRVLDALIENALNYSPRGSTVTVVTLDGRIEVHDEGPGLGPGEEEEVFERFHRGRAGHAGPPGTGLGLPIARELAGRWGGRVKLRSTSGGTVAVVDLPDFANSSPSRL